jgi:hypothetical protein
MDRRVNSTKKDRNGKIVAVCNPGQTWSPRSTKDVARDINSGRSSYYVVENARRSYLRTVSGNLEAGASATGADVLALLPTILAEGN